MLNERHWAYFRTLLPGAVAYAIDQAGMQRLFTTPNVMFSEQAGGRWVMRESGHQEKAIGLVQFGGRFEASGSLQLHPSVQQSFGAVPHHPPDSTSLPVQSPPPTLPEEAGPEAVYGSRPSDVVQQPPPPEVPGIPPGHPYHNGDSTVVRDAAGMLTTGTQDQPATFQEHDDLLHVDTEQVEAPMDLLEELGHLVMAMAGRMDPSAKNALLPQMTRVSRLLAEYHTTRQAAV